jgi:phosphotransferase system enzyme I (PtsP)
MLVLPMLDRPSRPKVHERGNRRLDTVLDFVAFAARPMPLTTLLDEAPRRIAAVFEADVCSLYLLEGDGQELVMRGNVGFGSTALGQVRLRIGEGITGEAVEYLRPVSADSAEQHESYKHFEELGEERFPVFLAVPLRGRSGPLGALVVQRRAVPFEASDVELLAVIGGLIAAGVRHAELIDARREKAPRRQAGGGTRKVTLPGRPVVAGRALGAVAAVRRPPPRPSEHVPTRSGALDDVRLLKSAFDVAEKAIEGLRGRARKLSLGHEASFLATYTEILGDTRFRERATELASTGMGLAQALGQVAREATRNAVSFTKDAYLEERMRDLEDLCDALTMLASNDKRGQLPSKAIVLADNLTVFDLLVSARATPVGVALSDRAAGPRTRALLGLMGVPSIVDVQGLFRWASDGDIALLDADHGLFILNPSKGEMASVREYKRDKADKADKAGKASSRDSVAETDE